MRTAADVTWNPKAGDVVIYGPQWQRERVEVLQITEHGIDVSLSGRLGFWTLAQWRRLTNGEEIVHVAK